jgi:hypothetical protein
MSKSKGRRYELEIIEKLRSSGIIVKDVAANCGVYGEHECDLLIDVHGDDVRGEVKFRHNGTGFKSVYNRHDAGSDGLPILWADGIATGTYGQYMDLHDGLAEYFEVDKSLPGVVVGWLSGRDVLFCRMARREWIVVWRWREAA